MLDNCVHCICIPLPSKGTDLNGCFESRISYLDFVIEAMIGKSEACVATIIGIGIEEILGRSEIFSIEAKSKQ